MRAQWLMIVAAGGMGLGACAQTNKSAVAQDDAIRKEDKREAKAQQAEWNGQPPPANDKANIPADSNYPIAAAGGEGQVPQDSTQNIRPDPRVERRAREDIVAKAEQELLRRQDVVKSTESECIAAQKDKEAAEADMIAAQANLRSARLSHDAGRIRKAEKNVVAAQRKQGINTVRTEMSDAARERAKAEVELGKQMIELKKVETAQAEEDWLKDGRRNKDVATPQLDAALQERMDYAKDQVQKFQEKADIAKSAHEQAVAQYKVLNPDDADEQLQAQQQRFAAPPPEQQQGTGGSGWHFTPPPPAGQRPPPPPMANPAPPAPPQQGY